MRAPTFLLAGVPKSGTTSLYGYLGQHPDVCLSAIKEPTFFGAQDLIAMSAGTPTEHLVNENIAKTRAGLDSGTTQARELGLVAAWEDYLRLFDDAGDATAVGEGSVSYWWLPGAARAIRERLPRVKLVFMLRDPADRLFSHYLGGLWHRPRLQFRRAFEDGLQESGDWSRAIRIGHYADHLARFQQLFPANQTRIYLFDDFRDDPALVLRDLFEFLDVDPSFPVDFSLRARQPAVPRYPWINSLLSMLPYRDWAVPARLTQMGRELLKRPRADVRMARADRERVVGYYREQILDTARLINRDLDHWLR